jgi:hypothetical protein
MTVTNQNVILEEIKSTLILGDGFGNDSNKSEYYS